MTATADPRIRSTLAGYRIEKVLGRGGMGIVYLAQDPWLERKVALKLLAPELSNDARFRMRFLRESKLAASLEHANVIPIYEAGDAEGSLYLAMRYVEGGDLRDLLETVNQLAPEQALEILSPVAAALDAAHEKGLVHRDVKPGNVLLASEGGQDGRRSVYLSDFGLTKVASEDPELAEPNQLFGTPEYIAPEQIQNEPVSAQTDVYAFGCVLYQVLTGEAPYRQGESSLGLFWAHLEEEPPKPSEHAGLPMLLDPVVARALAKNPSERQASCAELIAEASAALGLESAPARPIPTTRTALRNPYKGLRAFGEVDADDFFGRGALVDELLEHLADPSTGRFLALVGASGSGKSSAVKAGLLPKLRQGALPGAEQWTIIELLPGAHPLHELEVALRPLLPEQTDLTILREDPASLAPLLEQALPSLESELLLVIDQFEELFTIVEDEGRRSHFLALLSQAVTDPSSRLRLVVTLRADFYDRPLRYRDFAELVDSGLINVIPLSAEELERAIAAPAEQIGVGLKPGLVAEIVSDLADQPGALPLLQYALTELFERREVDLLTTEGYRAIGGVAGALGSRAEELYGGLAQDGQATARKLFTRLVTLGEGTEDTRRRILRGEVEAIESSEEAIDEVVDTYGRHRFLSFDRDPLTNAPTVEIAHEALLREWPRLRAWIDEDREGLRLLRHLSEAATGWQKLDRDPGELYSGTRLQAASDWASGHPDDLNPLEHEFLQTSQKAEAARIAQQARQNRRLRIALAVIAVALVGAIIGGVFALRESNRASDEATRAEEQAALAESEASRAEEEAARAEEEAVRAEAAAAEEADARAEAETARFEAETGRLVAEAAARGDDNRRQALLLAAESHRRAPSVETLGALQRALVGHGGFQGYLGGGAEYLGLEFSPDDERLIALANGTVEIYDLATRTLIEAFEIEESIVASASSGARAASLGPGGEDAIVATATGDVVVYSVEDGSAVATIRPDPEPVTAVAVAPNRGPIAVGHGGGVVSIWDRDGTRRVRFAANPRHSVTHLAFNAEGTLLATASVEVIFEPPPPEPGEPIPSAPARMWNTTTGAQVGADLPLTPEARGTENLFTPLASLAFSADGKTLITSDPATLRRWEVPSGNLLSTTVTPSPDAEESRASIIQGLAPAPGQRVVVAYEAGLAVIDDARNEPASVFVDPQVSLSIAGADAIAASRDGSLAVMGGTAGIFVWSLSGNQLLARAFPTGMPGVDFAFPLDENRLIWTAEAGSLDPSRPVVWDVRDPNPRPMPFAPSFYNGGGLGERFFHLAYIAPDEPIRVEVWDKQTLAYTGVDVLVPIIANDLERGLLIGAFDQQLFVMDVETGEIIEQREGFVDFFRPASFNADRTRMVTAVAGQANATLWDTETWDHVMDFRASEGNGVTAARFAPSGELVTADPTGTIFVRDPETLEPVGAPMIGPGAAFDLRFNGDGTRLLVLGEEAVLWDLAARTRIGDTFPVGDLWPESDSPDRAVSVEDDNILVWNLDPDEWYEIACLAAGRNMTRSEWEEFGPRDTQYQATCPQFPLEP